jgi:dihydrodipicolinate synthase/N-acetylneuraminate lyase
LTQALEATGDALLHHCRAVSQAIPLFGFYLQPAVGGRVLPYHFWREFCEIPDLVGIKIAPFNRYHTLDVLRAIADSGRADIALYTGNDDHIVLDLLHPRFAGGLLGHWAVWTKNAVEMLCRIRTERAGRISPEWFVLADQVTDCNAAFFDVANRFRGCIAGIHEVLRRQGLLEGRWLLDPEEDLSPGQIEEIDRVYRAYPHLNDDEFVRANLDRWLR